MLRRIHSLFVWCSAFFLLLTLFFVLHSIGRCDLWSWSTADAGEVVSSSATLGVGKGRVALNVWIHQDDGQARGTTLDHVVVGQGPGLRDGMTFSSMGGFALARGARASPGQVSYLGVMVPVWTLLVLFGALPVHAAIWARRRAEMRILRRLMMGASMASLALAVFLVVMWVRSFEYDYAAVPDRFFSENHAYLLSSQGITTWYFFDEPLRLRTPMWWRFPVGQSASRLAATMDPAARFLGFGRTRTTYFHGSMFSGILPPRPLTIVAIPYYALVAAALVLPVGMVTHQVGVMIRRRRKSKGQCPQCGYDVRATPERCPECGFVLEKADESGNSSPVAST
jgi:hypothetical protein